MNCNKIPEVWAKFSKNAPRSTIQTVTESIKAIIRHFGKTTTYVQVLAHLRESGSMCTESEFTEIMEVVYPREIDWHLPVPRKSKNG